jgi:hypothetical protein
MVRTIRSLYIMELLSETLGIQVLVFEESSFEPAKAAEFLDRIWILEGHELSKAAKGGWHEFLRTITDERHQIDLSWDDLTPYYAALGDKQKAFALLNKRVDEGLNARQASFDPRLDSLRDGPRFDEMLKRSGLK